MYRAEGYAKNVQERYKQSLESDTVADMTGFEKVLKVPVSHIRPLRYVEFARLIHTHHIKSIMICNRLWNTLMGLVEALDSWTE
jgi:hypothetical protein